MSKIDELTIRRVKEAASIVDVISDFYDLRRNGVNYECLCPFHEDQNIGSFKISPKRNRYHCFACNASGGPVDFLMEHEGLSFPDAIRWLGKKYSIDIDEEQQRFTMVKPAKPRPLDQRIDNLPTFEVPSWMVKSTLPRREDTNLVKWLRSLPWDGAARARIDTVLKCYFMAGSKEGHSIFWQCDEQGHFRTGKMMFYQENGHRDKELPRTWIHSRLKYAGQYDEDKCAMRQTLFGMHLLDMAPNATVNIVESEKTAIFMSIAYGGMAMSLWLATGGKSLLTARALKPIIDRGRRIVLYPDRDAITDWQQAAQQIGYQHLTVNTDPVTKWWLPEDGDKADIADVVQRMICQGVNNEKTHGLHHISDVLKEFPIIRPLVEKFKLEVVEEKTDGTERQ